jgi:hypothetical protein
LALTSTISSPWEGPAVDLLDTLTASLGDVRAPKGWPSGARALAILLKRRAPSLRRLGWTVEQLSERSERGTLWQITPPSECLRNPDEPADEKSRQDVRQGVRQASTPVLACEDVESGQNPDELTNETPKLLLTSSRSEERGPTREVPDSSSSQHSVRDCLACGEPLAADLIADNIHRHIGCAA